MSGLLRRLPLALTLLRALLAPVIVALAFLAPSAPALGACLLGAFLSDVFDGILARRLGVATPALRRADSLADTTFYVGVLLAVWRLAPTALVTRAAPLAALLGLEALRYVFDLAKFRREASYHLWTSKLWGIALFAGSFSLLAVGVDGPLASAALWLGILADLEGLAVSMVLRRLRSDVPTLLHALQLRGGG